MSDVVDNTTHKPRSNTAKRNRAYGFNAEAELLEYLRKHDIEAERLYLTGKEDEGDFFVSLPSSHYGETIIQLKTWTPRGRAGGERPLTPGTIRDWLAALEDQRRHYASHRGFSELPAGMLVVRFKGRAWDDTIVISQLKEWL